MAILTKENYLEELNDIKVKLKDFISKVEGGNFSYIKEIALKLRILYCNKSGTGPLLKTIMELYGFSINVVIHFSVEELVQKGMLSESLAQGLQKNINSPITWFERGHELLPIFEAVDRKKDVFLDGNYYNYKDIFENITDKMGGAHLDKSIPNEKLIPHSKDILLGGLSVAERTVYDMARISVELINIINGYLKNGEQSDFIKKS